MASQDFIKRIQNVDLLRISTAGSVDDGKSTLIGRLLLDSNNLYKDHIESAKQSDSGKLSLAEITDGLRAEREQGITIDVAYRYFSTPNRRFILADTPGHIQYTRNMATGASTADLSILVVDASKGILTQTKRHAFISALLGVPRLLVAVNKMDLVEYSPAVFKDIIDQFTNFAARLEIKEIDFIPVCALDGDNIVTRSKKMEWFDGQPLLKHLESVYIASDRNMIDFRFAVQCVTKAENFRALTGQINSGTISTGAEIAVLPSMIHTKIKKILLPSGSGCVEVEEAFSPQSISIVLEDELDVSRGHMIVRAQNIPPLQNQFEAIMLWMSEEPLDLSRKYLLRHATQLTHAYIDRISYGIDVNTLQRTALESLTLNDIGRVKISTTEVIPFDSYHDNRATGNCIIIEPTNNQTVGAAMLISRMPTQLLIHSKAEGKQGGHLSDHIHLESGKVTRKSRETMYGSPAVTLWFTGLSGSGKSTLAAGTEATLFQKGVAVYRLDGDNLRFGLNSDLSFTKEDRKQNVRRAAEVARLFNDAGITIICAFISPYKVDREEARQIIGEDSFVEIFVSTPLEECERRDPNGLYQKAREGFIREFTGVSAPYEPPENPTLTIDTSGKSVDECLRSIVDHFDTLTNRNH